MNLLAFGQKLAALRKAVDWTQETLAAKIPVGAFQLVSKWERGQKRPGRTTFIRLVELFAAQLSLQEALNWAALTGHALTPADLQRLPLSLRTHPLDLLPSPRLFGVDQSLTQLQTQLEQADEPWLIAVGGLGGIGKTSLAAAVARRLDSSACFTGLAWVSAKQQELLPGQGPHSTGQPALDAGLLVDQLLAQLQPHLSLARSPAEKLALLTARLKSDPYLIIIDNLETTTDYETVLPTLARLANPTKILLTCRHKLTSGDGLYALTLPGLAAADGLAFLRYQAKTGHIPALLAAGENDLKAIYRVVGGNPLALKLVAGQTTVWPLARVLERIQQAEGQETDQLYTFIYWDDWHALDDAGKKLLVAMPVAQGGNRADLTGISQLSGPELDHALKQLVKLSLVEVGPGLDPRYTIHPLTESFLLKEVLKWQLEK